ncbi:MAG: DUF116 domain-containing protein [Candidatus Cloacimonas sp.]
MKKEYFAIIKFPVFVGLSLLIVLLIFFFMVLGSYHNLGLSAWGNIFYTLIFILIIVLIASWILTLISTHRKIKPRWLRIYLSWVLSHIFYHLAMWISVLFFQKKTSMQESFLYFNNEIVVTNYQGMNSKNLLLLLPHCLQNSNCKIRINNNIVECQECGGCDMAKMKAITRDRQIKAAVASGGSLARKLVKDTHPDIIIAVACHRDLTDGVRESWRYPVYSVLNERPKGPCFETTVSSSVIDFAVNKFI